MRPPLPEIPREALVLGLGESGEAAARLLARRGSRVTVVDRAGGPAQEARREALAREGIAVHLNATDRLPEGAFGLAVASPGIPATSPWFAQLAQGPVPVWAELELGWRLSSAPVLAVTGSNGKSTLVTLCRDALRLAGRAAVMAGNCSPPLCQVLLDGTPVDWLVLEVSTFQLEGVVAFCPDVGILLNVFPNHLDRHGTLEVYQALKARLFARMGPRETAIVCESVPEAVRAQVPAAVRRVSFGLAPAADYRYEPGRVVRPRGGRSVDLAGSVFDNEVLGQAAAAATAAVEACGVDPACVGQAAAAFRRLPHRTEFVAEARGVRFVDDSKATNLAALMAALRIVPGPVRLIAGGLLKEHDLEPAKKVLFKKATGVYIIGACAQVMHSAWSEAAPCVVCHDLKQAVSRAWKEARPGETILLSPGCASFDQFRGFGERGTLFCSIVQSLIQGGEP
jgi:UDP-N-acetylmuramoylalanine--D-glutamate ligase